MYCRRKCIHDMYVSQYLCGLPPIIYLSKTLKILTLILWSTKAKTTDNRQKKTLIWLKEGLHTHSFGSVIRLFPVIRMYIETFIYQCALSVKKYPTYQKSDLIKYVHVPLQHENAILSNYDILVQCTCTCIIIILFHITALIFTIYIDDLKSSLVNL